TRDRIEHHARRIKAALPEDHQPAFRDAIRMASYPGAYVPSWASRDMAHALRLEDLTNDQRQAIQDLKAAHEQEVKPLNDARVIELAAEDTAKPAWNVMSADPTFVMYLPPPPKPRPADKAAWDAS